MKAAAYQYADGGSPSFEILAGNYIDRFGVQAVYGRTLGWGEMRRIVVAENIVNAYRARANSRDPEGNMNWAEWARTHESDAALLNEAMILAGGEDGE